MSFHFPRGNPPSPEDVYAFIRDMTPVDRFVLFSVLSSAPFREIIRDTGYIVVSDDEASNLLEGAMIERQEAQAIIEQFKAKLGKKRTSDPATIKRNVEICDLRKQDKKYWSHGQLGLKYGMNKRSVARILKDEEKWRQLASQLPE
jgi:hypothetical protein